MSDLIDSFSTVQATLLSFADLFQRATVYLDDGAAEVISTAAGPDFLLGLGAISISRLQDASSSTISAAHFLNSSTPVTNIVVITTTFIGDVEPHINHLLHLHLHSSPSPTSSSLSIISSLSEQLHTEELPNIYGPNCFSILRDRLITGHPHLFNTNSNNNNIKVVYAPSLNMCPITSNIFTLPPSSAAASLPHALGLPAGWCPVEDIEQQEEDYRDRDQSSSSLFSSKHQGAALLSHTLSHIAASMGCRVEGFTLGPFSKLIGRALAFVPPPPPSSSLAHSAAPERSAALILVDRVMDLVSPSLCEDILVQKMFHITTTATREGEEEGEGGGLVAPWSIASMPELYQSHIKIEGEDDGEEGSSSVNEEKKKNNFNLDKSVLSGTMMHPHDKEATRQLEFLIMTRKGKDAPLFIRKWLKEALRKEGMQPSIKMKPGSSVAPGELATLASPLLNLSPTSATTDREKKLVKTATTITTKESSSKSPSRVERHLSLLQLALAADQAIDGTNNKNEGEEGKGKSTKSIMKRYNALATEQNHCMLSCSEGSAAVVSFLLDLIPLVTSSRNVLTLVDVFSLILMAHTIRLDFVPWFGGNKNNNIKGFEGAFSADEEAQILHCIMDHLTRDNDNGSGVTRGNILPLLESSVLCHPEGDVVLRQYIHSLADLFQHSQISTSITTSITTTLSSEVLKLQLRDILSDILARLRHLAAFHHHHSSSSSLKELKRTTRISQQDGSISPAPLLEQLTERALMPGEVISDLTPAAASLAGLLKTGLGRFGIQKAQPKPSDHDVVMIFVVGGASVGEIHHVMQAASAVQQMSGSRSEGGKSGPTPPQKKIIFGCTRLLT